MGGSFTSPFNSASKLEKIVHNLSDNACDSIEVRFSENKKDLRQISIISFFNHSEF